MFVILLFVFKQKTAYEMRISDWSSDVCSSDLSGLHIAGWLIVVAIAWFLPFVGFAAMRRFGRQLWPLFVGWDSLALFIVYAAIASMGLFAWLPINWHLAWPVGLFESLLVTLALGPNLKKIRPDTPVWKGGVTEKKVAERVELGGWATIK